MDWPGRLLGQGWRVGLRGCGALNMVRGARVLGEEDWGAGRKPESLDQWRVKGNPDCSSGPVVSSKKENPDTLLNETAQARVQEMGNWQSEGLRDEGRRSARQDQTCADLGSKRLWPPPWRNHFPLIFSCSRSPGSSQH